MENLDLQSIFEQAKKDPTLFSTLDIQSLLESVEHVKNDYLENRTMTRINEDIYAILCETGLETSKIENLCEKLIGYRYVDKINEIHKGKHIRWIRILEGQTQGQIQSQTQKKIPIDNIKLMAGGFVTNIKFLDNGTHIQCMGPGNRFIQYKFDECISFQKLTIEEQLLLMAYQNML